MKASRTTSRQARRIHRWLVPIAAAPLLITAGTGSLYSLLLEQNIDAFWLLKLHTGQFGWLNLQPVYPILLGALTIVVTVSGLTMLLRPARTTGVNHPDVASLRASAAAGSTAMARLVVGMTGGTGL